MTQFELTVFVLLAVFWASTLLVTSVPFVSPGRLLAGLPVILLFPGLLLVDILGLRTTSTGRDLLLGVGISLVILTLLCLCIGIVLPWVGIDGEELTRVLGIGISVVLLMLLFIHFVAEIEPLRSTSHFSIPTPSPVIVLVALLPTVAVVGAYIMNRWEQSVGMYIFVTMLIGVVLLTATRYIPSRLYAVTIFLVAVSTVLHRGLLSGHVIGADIQAIFAAADAIVQTGRWGPDVLGQLFAIPVVTYIPVSLAFLTGMQLAVVFKLVNAVLFALVPVGIFYISSDLYDPEVGLYGALAFVFFHVSFYFTPGKQLLSELFVVLLLMVLFQSKRGLGRVSAIFLLSAGLIWTHYAMTYVFAFAMLIGFVSLFAIAYSRDSPTGRFSVKYPVVLLVGASAWYSTVSGELFATITSVPASLADQVVLLAVTGTIEGSGASFAAQQTSTLEHVNLLLYVILTVLIGLGLAWQTLVVWRQMNQQRLTETAPYLAISVPLFGFLAASYFFSFNLWADRVYQMVLTILAPFAPLGVTAVPAIITSIRRGSIKQLRLDTRARLAIVVILILVAGFNTGLVFAVADDASTSTFNSQANDLVFSEKERAGAQWIGVYGNVSRFETAREQIGTRTAVDSPDRVQIYTDKNSYQLFRSTLPQKYHDTEVVELKNQWQPELHEERIADGYIYIRTRTLESDRSADNVQLAAISVVEYDALSQGRDLVYCTDRVRILVSNETSSV